MHATSNQTNHVVRSSPSAITDSSEISPLALSCAISSSSSKLESLQRQVPLYQSQSYVIPLFCRLVGTGTHVFRRARLTLRHGVFVIVLVLVAIVSGSVGASQRGTRKKRRKGSLVVSQRSTQRRNFFYIHLGEEKPPLAMCPVMLDRRAVNTKWSKLSTNYKIAVETSRTHIRLSPNVSARL